MNAWITIMPGVYAPVRVKPAPEPPAPPASRTRPAWLPGRIVRPPRRRYSISRCLPY